MSGMYCAFFVKERLNTYLEACFPQESFGNIWYVRQSEISQHNDLFFNFLINMLKSLSVD